MSNICSDSTTNVDSLASSKRLLQTGDNPQQPDHHKKARRPRRADGDGTAGVSAAAADPEPLVKTRSLSNLPKDSMGVKFQIKPPKKAWRH